MKTILQFAILLLCITHTYAGDTLKNNLQEKTPGEIYSIEFKHKTKYKFYYITVGEKYKLTLKNSIKSKDSQSYISKIKGVLDSISRDSLFFYSKSSRSIIPISINNIESVKNNKSNIGPLLTKFGVGMAALGTLLIIDGNGSAENGEIALIPAGIAIAYIGTKVSNKKKRVLKDWYIKKMIVK